MSVKFIEKLDTNIVVSNEKETKKHYFRNMNELY